MSVLVVGLGEVGKPLLDVLSAAYACVGRDVGPMPAGGPVAVMHVCYPWTAEFAGTTVGYIREYAPDLTIVHSTVVPGTTRQIREETGAAVAYSPVRGKHTKMREELLSYTKLVASPDAQVTQQADDHLRGAGMRVEQFASVEGLELAKLLETTYFGLLIAWAQESERFCRAVGAEYNDVMRLMQEIDYLPPVAFHPGFIGGHCVIPNTYLLERVRPSAFLDLIRSSNDEKREEWLRQGRSLDDRLSPQRIR